LINGYTFVLNNDTNSTFQVRQLNFTTAMSAELWVNFDALPSTYATAAGSVKMIYKVLSGSKFGYELIVNASDNKPSFKIWNGTSTAATSSTALTNAGQWYHIVGTFDGSSIKIYVDGVLCGTTAYAGSIPSAGDTDIKIGATTATQTNPCSGVKGWMDEVRLYDKALTDAEVLGQFSTVSATPTPTPTPDPAATPTPTPSPTPTPTPSPTPTPTPSPTPDPAATPTPTPPPVSITNAGFEDVTLAGWTPLPDTSIALSSGGFHTGAKGAKVTNTTQSASQTLTGLIPNTSYTLSAWMKGSGAIKIGAKDFGGTTVESSVPTLGTYAQFSINFTTGAANTTAVIYVIGINTTAGYIDDVTITSP